MPRIRTVQPVFWTDEKVAKCSRDARLTLIGIFTLILDDAGRGPANPKIIRSTVYPMDDDISSTTVAAHLDEIVGQGILVRYTVNGQEYIYARNWFRHQKIDHPSRSRVPPPPREETDKPRESVAKGSRDPRETLGNDRIGREGMGGENFKSNYNTKRTALSEHSPNPEPPRADGGAKVPREKPRDAASSDPACPDPHPPGGDPAPNSADSPPAGPSSKGSGPRNAAKWTLQAQAVFQRHIGHFDAGRIGKRLKPVHDAIGTDQLLAALETFGVHHSHVRPPARASPEGFAERYADFLPFERGPNGELSAEEKRLAQNSGLLPR